MPQANIFLNFVQKVAGGFAQKPGLLDANQNLQVAPQPPAGITRTLNITAATVVKATPGTIYSISIVVAGSADGAIYDHATTSGVAAANQIGAIPQTDGGLLNYGSVGFPCTAGIVIVPGTGQTISIAYA
jgi:hypothetical protein